MSELPPPPGSEPPAEWVPTGGWPPIDEPDHAGAAAGLPSTPVLAGFWRRLAAALVDDVILGAALLVLGLVLGADELGFRIGAGYSPLLEPLLNILSLVMGVAYYATLEGGPKGQTLGKQALGIRVVDAASAAPGIGVPRGVGRYFGRILSALPLYLGYFWMLWDARQQTWHDKLARTLVVRAD